MTTEALVIELILLALAFLTGYEVGSHEESPEQEDREEPRDY